MKSFLIFSESNDFCFIRFLLLFLLSFIYHFSHSQFPDTARIYNFGTQKSDFIGEIKQTSDSGYVIVGTINGLCSETKDIYLLKIDSTFTYQWSYSYGGPNIEWGYSVEQTFDGGYALVGFTNSYGVGGYDVYLVKTDSVGDISWTKTFGGTDWDFGYSLKQTTDSGFVICGTTYSFGNGMQDVYVIKTNKDGDTLWTKTFGGTNDDVARKVVVYKDSIYMVVGETSSFGTGDIDVYLLAIHQSGNLLYDTTYGSTKKDFGNSIYITSDNGFLIMGSSDSLSSDDEENMDFYIIRTDSIGFPMWQRFYNTTLMDIGRDAIELSNGNIVLCGTCSGCGAGGKGLLMQLLNSGGWWLSGPAFGGVGEEEGYSVIENVFGELVFAGTTTSYGQGFEDIYLIRIKKNIVMDYTLSITNYADTSCTTGITSIGNEKDPVIFPNPFHDYFHLIIPQHLFSDGEFTFEMYDCYGNKVKNISNIRATEFLIDRNSISNGIYFYYLSNNKSYYYAGKLVVQ